MHPGLCGAVDRLIWIMAYLLWGSTRVDSIEAIVEMLVFQVANRLFVFLDSESLKGKQIVKILQTKLTSHYLRH